jgi:uncharacterized membrane protein YedE/YeeE
MTARRILTVILILALADRLYQVVRDPPQDTTDILRFGLLIVVLVLGLWANLTARPQLTPTTEPRVREIAILIVGGLLLYLGVVIGHVPAFAWVSTLALGATAAILLWALWRLHRKPGTVTR